MAPVSPILVLPLNGMKIVSDSTGKGYYWYH
jgi:hypothetical protein